MRKLLLLFILASASGGVAFTSADIMNKLVEMYGFFEFFMNKFRDLIN